MKYYRVVNLNRQHLGYQVIPEKGWLEIQKNPEIAKVMHNMGECDASGAILTEIKQANFLTKVENKPENFKAATDPEQLSESAPQLQTFDEPKSKINEGTGRKTKAGKAEAGK